MKTPIHPIKEVIMWNEVKHLHDDLHLKPSEIGKKLSIDTRTVKKFLSRTESEVIEQAIASKVYKKALDPYRGFIKGLLLLEESLSAASIEDKLKEKYPDFPKVDSKTVYNYVMRVREEEKIPKQKSLRVYEERLEVEYGSEAQVDFGEYKMLKQDGNRIKVHVFSMVLSRSRQKYLVFQLQKNTTQTAVEAHVKAFEFFEGIPQSLLYDQDSVFLNDENLGDLILTQGFQSFKESLKLKTNFCRKADPESKGRIENVIGYIKDNFLNGRIFKDIDTLNQEAIAWLYRTANAKVHNTTRLVPMEEWEKEKLFLRPLSAKFNIPEPERTYAVRKTNVVMYKTNSYSLPEGFYQDGGTQVFLKIKDGMVILKDLDHKLIAKHDLCLGRGQQIINTDHRRNKELPIKKMKQELLLLLPESEKLKEFAQKIHQDKSKYARENLQEVRKGILKYNVEIVEWALDYCLTNDLFNATRFKEALSYKHQKIQEANKSNTKPKEFELKLVGNVDANNPDLTPETSKIGTYDQIVAQA